jgi:hypothetical protein
MRGVVSRRQRGARPREIPFVIGCVRASATVMYVVPVVVRVCYYTRPPLHCPPTDLDPLVTQHALALRGMGHASVSSLASVPRLNLF